MLVLEVLECDHPYETDWLGQPAGRVVPARWWAKEAYNPKWVEVCRLHWWQLWRLRRVKPRNYWPLRLRRLDAKEDGDG